MPRPGVPPEIPHQPLVTTSAATLYTGLDPHKRTVFALTVNADELARGR